MTKKIINPQRRKDALSRELIIEASIALLDERGESGFTFRALAEKLATGSGAIYWHVANKNDVLIAACDAIVAQTMNVSVSESTPTETICNISVGMFDAIDAHPWVGSALTKAPSELPMVRIIETIGQKVCALGVPEEQQWSVISALLNYILGVSGQNAANSHLAKKQNIDRINFLKSVADTWAELDVNEYPFICNIAKRLPNHDDRADFLSGIKLILSGIKGLELH